MTMDKEQIEKSTDDIESRIETLGNVIDEQIESITELEDHKKEISDEIWKNWLIIIENR